MTRKKYETENVTVILDDEDETILWNGVEQDYSGTFEDAIMTVEDSEWENTEVLSEEGC